MLYLSLMWYLLFTLILVAPPIVPYAFASDTNRFKSWLNKRKELREFTIKAEKENAERLAKIPHQRRIHNKIGDAVAARIKRRGHVFFWVVLGVSVYGAKYMCDRGGLGCQRKKPEKEK